jgi:copper oxidase (laccase) domain-containing protein
MQGVVHGFGAAGMTIEEYLAEFDDVIIHSTDQVHGNAVHLLDCERTNNVLKGDAFITSQPGIACFIRTADCVPILIADPVKKAVGAIHAGWRGTESNVAGEAIKKMQQTFGSNPTDIRAAIGPAICGKCYEADLITANHDLLVNAGVKEGNIDTLKMCTHCGDYELASYHLNKTDVRQINFIVLRD